MTLVGMIFNSGTSTLGYVSIYLKYVEESRNLLR